MPWDPKDDLCIRCWREHSKADEAVGGERQRFDVEILSKTRSMPRPRHQDVDKPNLKVQAKRRMLPLCGCRTRLPGDTGLTVAGERAKYLGI